MLQNSWLFPHRPFDVQAFFERIESPRLRDMPDLPAWIDAAARAEDLRAEWLCGLVQKEQSGLTKGTLSQHGRDWLCGYGYTEGPVYSRFRGARNQVYSAARGLRRYLTPGDSLYVGDWVGRQKVFDGRTGIVRNLAEACALQYTPHWSTLTTVERIWRHYGFEDGGEALASTADVERIARRICAEFAAGNRGVVTIGRVSFNLRDVAYCSRFVRECCEAAMGTAEYGVLTARYFGGSARETEAKLRAKAERVAAHKAVPGDIVCFNAGAAGEWGHIGIHLGNGQFAENTSSKTRGPGFVVSAYDAIGTNRISGFYHLPEFEREEGADTVKIILGTGPEPEAVIDANAQVEDGTLRADVRPLLEALGYTLHPEHIKTQGKLYIEEATQ